MTQQQRYGASLDDHVFALRADVESTPVGEVPDGYRIDLHYGDTSKDSDVLTDGKSTHRDNVDFILPAWQQPQWDTFSGDLKSFCKTHWGGLRGKLVSGTDRVLVRTDGVVKLSGRVTIKADDGPLINCTYTGCIDLLAPGQSGDGYSRWLRGQLNQHHKGPADQREVALSVSFECSDTAQPWASERYKEESALAWRYQFLNRRLFVAVGTVAFKGDQSFSPLESVQLNVLRLGLTPLASPGAVYGTVPAISIQREDSVLTHAETRVLATTEKNRLGKP